MSIQTYIKLLYVKFHIVTFHYFISFFEVLKLKFFYNFCKPTAIYINLYVEVLLGDLSTKTNYQLSWNLKQVCTSKLSTLSDTVNLKLASSVVLYDKFGKRTECDLDFKAIILSS